MKRILLCLMVALFATGCLFAKNNDEKMNVMSYNIRYDNSGDKDNQWKFRRDFAADLVKFYEADVFGAQEVLNNQLNDLLNRLPEYAYVGVGREDGKTKGEYAPIFYRKDRFSVEKSGNFWLAEDINAIGKKGWAAATVTHCMQVFTKDERTVNVFLRYIRFYFVYATVHTAVNIRIIIQFGTFILHGAGLFYRFQPIISTFEVNTVASFIS